MAEKAEEEKKKHPGGRPSKYKDVDLSMVEKLAKKGWTDVEMSDFFCVNIATWHRWKGKHEEFCDSLKDWKVEADKRVERSLYERACGYSHPEDKIFMPAGADKPVVVPTVKHYPPDTTAGIYWTKNRMPGEWSDRKEHEHTIKDYELTPPEKPNED